MHSLKLYFLFPFFPRHIPVSSRWTNTACGCIQGLCRGTEREHSTTHGSHSSHGWSTHKVVILHIALHVDTSACPTPLKHPLQHREVTPIGKRPCTKMGGLNGMINQKGMLVQCLPGVNTKRIFSQILLYDTLWTKHTKKKLRKTGCT